MRSRYVRCTQMIGLLFVLMGLIDTGPNAAERRTALVIGNAAYDVGRLRHPVNDASDVAQTLREVGFDATLLTNTTRRQIRDAVETLRGQLTRGGVGVFYYAGHGMHVQSGRNYLIPLGAQITSEADIEDQGVSAEWVVAKMGEAGNALNIVILDACRDNPYTRLTRSGTRGLARMGEPVDTLVAYAAEPGAVAEDGTGRNGVYTKHLLQQMRRPGLSVEQVFKYARAAVMEETQNKQRPQEWSTLRQDFAFVPAIPAAPALTTPGGIQVAVGTYPPTPPAPLPRTLVNSIGMQFALIPAGEFQMGSNDGDEEEKPVHTVRISKPFYLGAYEVTQGQWRAIMGTNPSRFTGDPDLPVESVSWEDIQEFICRLSQKEGITYRLPTEAEWEYAARAGTTTAYSFGNDTTQLGKYAWYGGNSGNKTHPVGQKRPNAWELYDMHGNVWEWVHDWFEAYTTGAQTDPTGPSLDPGRVIRGCGWSLEARTCRSAIRTGMTPAPDGRSSRLGFRLLRTAP